MSALDELLKEIPNDYDEIDVANHLLHFREKSKHELSKLRNDKLKLEIAARDFLRAFAMRGQILSSEFSKAYDTLAAMVNKGDE